MTVLDDACLRLKQALDKLDKPIMLDRASYDARIVRKGKTLLVKVQGGERERL